MMRGSSDRAISWPVVLFASAMLLALLGLCACSPSERALEESAGRSSASSSGASMASNDDAVDAEVPLGEVSVVVYNACGIEGLAAMGEEKLKEMGVSDAVVKNSATPSGASMVVHRSPEHAPAARLIADELGIETLSETSENSHNGWYYEGDIAVLLSVDWALAEGIIDELPQDDSWLIAN